VPSSESATGCSREASAALYDSGLPKYWKTTSSRIATMKTTIVRWSIAAAPGGGSGRNPRSRVVSDESLRTGAAPLFRVLALMKGRRIARRASSQLNATRWGAAIPVTRSADYSCDANANSVA